MDKEPSSQKPYPIIGMSPGNSYFKDEEIRYLLKTLIGQFGKVGILIADVPAISTYVGLGYPENRARRDKAIPQGNALKNRVRKVMYEQGYSDEVVRIFDWQTEIEENTLYIESYKKVDSAVRIAPLFSIGVGITQSNAEMRSVATSKRRSVSTS